EEVGKTNKDCTLIVTTSSGKDIEVNPCEENGGWQFVMPTEDVKLTFKNKTMLVKILDGLNDTTNASELYDPATSPFSLGEFDANGNAKLQGTVGRGDVLNIFIRQGAYDSGIQYQINVEAWKIESDGQSSSEKVGRDLGTPECKDVIYSIKMPLSFEVNGVPFSTIYVKITSNKNKSYMVSAKADATVRTTTSTTSTPSTTPTTPATPSAVAKCAQGEITVTKAVNLGDTIFITVNPYEGYYLKKETLKLTITYDDGTQEKLSVGMNANGSYYYTLPANLTAGKKLKEKDPTALVVSGTFAKNTGGVHTTQKSTFSAGVGVNVTITEHSNSAYVQSGTIECNGLTINAESSGVKSGAESVAGYSEGDIGIAGAITVHVASAVTKAYINAEGNNKPVIILNGGDLKVTASTKDSEYKTNAEGSGDEGASASNTGVGAGIAVAVLGSDTLAYIPDNADIRITDPNGLDSVEVNAEQEIKEQMVAKAGSAGGTSVTPVLALTISAATSEAYIGNLAIDEITAGDIMVIAINNIN
ncbi:MAG: hypothetical protein IK123_10735, partial [Lachnospiraceae bacterium]|nr:hypothetical protein [Lachnospiraceae bacterium]